MSVATEVSWVTEQQKYENAWNTPEYREGLTEFDTGSRSYQLWMECRSQFPNFITALDIGCGRGLLLEEWNRIGYDAWGIDIASNCLDSRVAKAYGHKVRIQPLWHMRWLYRQRFDLGICTDVMEHIPPEYVLKSLERIARSCNHVLFRIASAPCEWKGVQYHLTVKPQDWWVDAMESISGAATRLETCGTGGLSDEHRTIRWIP